jgi:ectoine hydroxylase-related dioxygenase (phytanoyl-CoA dioxygenase family)
LVRNATIQTLTRKNAQFYFLNGYQHLNVTKLDILDGDEINSRHFDELIELIATADTDIIVDNGASSFVPMSHYLITKISR